MVLKSLPRLLLLPVALLGFLSLSPTQCHATEVETRREIPPWPPATSADYSANDLHNEYYNIFLWGNRNAASHRWATFLLNRADQMELERLEFFFRTFCAVSGSPVRPSEYNRYRLTLPLVGTGTTMTGFMQYCCWPCVCDTQDFIRVDTKTIVDRNGDAHVRYFNVIGNPCDRPEELTVEFTQPFYGRRSTTLAEVAREVRCEGNVLEGATLSDHGYPIIGMFLDAVPTTPDMVETLSSLQPGRLSTNENNTSFQDEREYTAWCFDRAKNGYNSGMGEIFRKVSDISPITGAALLGGPSEGGQSSHAPEPTCPNPVQQDEQQQ